MKKAPPMSVGEAWFLLVVGILLGTVFTFGMQFWNAPISEQDAVHETAVFSSFEIQYGRSNSPKEIIVRFVNHDQLSIDGVCVTTELINTLKTIRQGDAVTLVIHPNSDTILEMQYGDISILEFSETSEKLTNEASGFMVLGILCYLAGISGLWRLIVRKR